MAIKTPDHNPDRDGHLSDEYMVIKSSKDPAKNGVELDGQDMRFGKKGAFKITGHARANALRQKYHPTDIVVTRMRHSVEQGHRYFFTSPGVPWGKYDELGRRVFDGEEESETQEEGKGLQERTSPDRQEAGH